MISNNLYRRYSLRIAVGILILAILLLAGHARATTTVVATGYIPYFDMVIDSNGKAHIAYEDVLINKLYYTNDVNGSWQTPEFISSTSDVGGTEVSLDVDSAGKIHIAFDSGSGGNDVFTYAQNTSGIWSTEVVRTNSRYYSLAVDTANRPHVAYYYDYNGLNYAFKSGGSWTNQNVDSSGHITAYAGRDPDLALDSSGKAHMVYFDYLNSSIKYANNSADSWNIETVVSSVDCSGAIDLDSANNPHVAYAKNGNIVHSQRTDSGWVEEIVASGSYYVNNAALIDIDLDASGIPYIIYMDPNRQSLLLSEKTSGTWKQSVLYFSSNNYALWGGVLNIFNQTLNVAVSDTNANHLLYIKHLVQLPKPPNITSFAPSSPVNDIVTEYEGATRTFNITIDQTVNVTWSIDGTFVQANMSVTEANYTKTSAAQGTWNVIAVATNANGTAMKTWVWNVTPVYGRAFYVNSNQNIGSNSVTVEIGDIDNDSDLDLIFGKEANNEVYFNNGGIFNFGYAFARYSAFHSKCLKLGDINNDGNLEIIENVLLSGPSHKVVIYANDGNGSYSYSYEVNPVNQPPGYFGGSHFIELADIDNDGDLDLAISALNIIELWLNDGNGNYVFSQTLPGSWTKDLTFGDIDNDGDVDLIASNSENSPNYVFKNNGNGNFVDTGQLLGNSYTYASALGDIDNDSDLDLVEANIAAQNKIYLNDGSGNFSLFYSFGALHGYSHPVVFGDIDNNNNLDMVIGGDITHVYLNNGTGQFIESGDDISGTSGLLGNVALGDIDSDGDLDLVTAGIENNLYICTLYVSSMGIDIIISDTPVIGINTSSILKVKYTNFSYGDSYNISITAPNGTRVYYDNGTLSGASLQIIPINWTPSSTGNHTIEAGGRGMIDSTPIYLYDSAVVSPIPELSTAVLTSAGLLGVLFISRKFRKN